MRGPRFRIRSLMIAMALLALTMTAGRAWQHWQIRRDRAAFLASIERFHRTFAVCAPERAVRPNPGIGVSSRNRLHAQEHRARATAEAARKREYERAPSRFWLPIPADAGAPFAPD